MLLKFQDFSSSPSSRKAAGPWWLVCGSDKAMKSRFRSKCSRGKEENTVQKTEGGRPGTEGIKQCFLYSSQLSDPKSSWGHTPNAVVHSYPQSKQNEWFKKKNFISILSIKCTVRDGVRMLGILREIKTGTWNEAESYRVSGWEFHSQCPWPAGCAQTEQIASHPSSLRSSHLARSHPAIHLHKSLAQL